MTDQTGDQHHPATDPTTPYDPPPAADPAPWAPENYDPPSPDATIAEPAAADTTAADPVQGADSPAGTDGSAADSAADPVQHAESPVPAADADGAETPPTGFPAPDTAGPAQAAGFPAHPAGFPDTGEQPGQLPPGAYETPAAYIPGTPYPSPGQPAPQAYQQPYPHAYGQPYPPPGPFGRPAPYGQPYPAPPRGQDNALAIGALVCSILGFCSGVTALAGIVMGHIALSRTNRGEAGGRGMATAAVIVGYVVLALWIGFFTTLIILGTNGYLGS